MAAVKMNAIQPVEAQLVLSLDDLIKQRRELMKQEKKAAKEEVFKSKKQPAKKNQSNTGEKKGLVAKKKKKNVKTTKNASIIKTNEDVKRIGNKKNLKLLPVQNNKDNTSPSTPGTNGKKKKFKKKNENTNQINQLNTQSNKPSKKNQVQVKIHGGKNKQIKHFHQKTISPSNDKSKIVQINETKDQRKVLFKVTMNNVQKLMKNTTISKKKKQNTKIKHEHPVKRLLGSHLPGVKTDKKKPKMGFKRRAIKKA